VFSGPNQAVAFEFSGVEKIKYLPEFVALLERLVGAKIRWAVIRDGDGDVPQVRAEHERVAREAGIPVFHMWSCYGLENLLLSADLLLEAIRKRKPGAALDASGVRTLLGQAAEQMEGEFAGVLTAKTQAAYREFKLSANPPEDGASAAIAHLRSLTTLEARVAAYPGKRLFGLFVERLQAELGVNLRIEDIVAEVASANAPPELRECMAKLEAV
jgi:hypothetical protein